jgi:hypothetical protein
MVHRLVVASLVLVGAVVGSAHAADALSSPAPHVVDPAKAKAKELEKQRLIAKLHAEVPKVVDLRSGTNPLDAPIFHRYDRP